MTKASANLIRSLWPLPGGNKRYLNTLDRIVRWAAATEEPTRDAFNEWLMSQYNVSEGTVSGYFRVVATLGALKEGRSSRLSLTPLGEAVLRTEGEEKAKLVIDRFMRDYLAFPEVLAVYAEAEGPIHLSEVVETLQPQFPRWTSAAQFEYRALWLLSLGCLRQVEGRNYEITELGERIAAQYPAAVHIEPLPKPGSGEEVEEEEAEASRLMKDALQLIADLEEASTDTQNPEHLERAVADAFGFLGFSVDQLGETGDTDVLARADTGPDSYVVIVDAKARGDGKLHSLEVYTLQDHLRRNEADYAIVVAGSFAGGKVRRHAEDNGVVLLSVPMLAECLRLQARTPLNLNDYRVVFETPGLVEDLPVTLKSAEEGREQWAHLLVDLVELIEETYQHGLNQLLPSDHLFTMLVTRMRGVRYPKQQVEKAIALLAHPALGAALGDGEAGISLAMNRETVVRVLRALANKIETVEAGSES
jgi:hypothetical protein